MPRGIDSIERVNPKVEDAGARYVARLVDPLLERLLEELPALQLVGPRACGKTTTARRLAATTVALDDPNIAAAFTADPDAALRGLAEPVLVDEWQVVPEVLGAIKRSVDHDSRPGRYLVTGSVRAPFEAHTWPGTGRIVNIAMGPFTERELSGDARASSWFDRLLTDEDLPSVAIDGPDLRDYVELAVRGGFPEVVKDRSVEARNRWLASYVDHVVTRDGAELVDRDPHRLRRYLEAVAANTAGIVDDKRLYDAAGITRPTAAGYERLLQSLYLLDLVPAWSSNRLQRIVSQSKRYLVDPALAASVIGVGADDVLRDGDLLGRLLDTYVIAQLRAEAEVAARRPRLHHLRDQGGRHEIDLIADFGHAGVVAFEIKATATPKPAMARHLVWLRDRLGDRFLRGVLFHTGVAAIELGDRMVALPISAIGRR